MISPFLFALLATIGSAWAVIWNVLAARSSPDRTWSRVFYIIAAFSAFYLVAWGVLLVHPDIDRAAWSEAVTPASVMSFFVVWGAPASIVYFRARSRRIADEEIARILGAGPDA